MICILRHRYLIFSNLAILVPTSIDPGASWSHDSGEDLDGVVFSGGSREYDWRMGMNMFFEVWDTIVLSYGFRMFQDDMPRFWTLNIDSVDLPMFQHRWG